MGSRDGNDEVVEEWGLGREGSTRCKCVLSTKCTCVCQVHVEGGFGVLPSQLFGLVTSVLRSISSLEEP